MISVIMLTYNREKFVFNMIEDVLKQSYKNFEFLIIDNGSVDGTPLLLNKYSDNDTRIRIITLPGGSIGHARNVGVNSAKGDYIAFVDDDDRIETDYLEFLYNLVQSNEADIAICGTSEGDGCSRKPQCILNEKRVMSGEEAVRRLCGGFRLKISGKGNRSGHDFPCDVQAHIRPGGQSPFDQPDTHGFDFEAGNAAGMDAASAVIIIRIVFGQSRTVCVPGDQNVIFLIGPVVQALFCFVLSRIVFGRAGGIEYAVAFQRFPQISDEKTGKFP